MITITEADLNTTVIQSSEQWISSVVSGWYSFWMYGNILEPNTTYYFVFEMWSQLGMGASPLGNHSWFAEQHNSSSYNKGATLTYNGSAWNPIPNDDSTDMLCRFYYYKVIDPSAINLTFSIDGQSKPYQRRIAGWGGGYECYYNMRFSAPPVQFINLTITSNTTLTNVNFFIRLFYVYRVPASGSYNATTSRIEWTMTYPHRYVDAWAFPQQWFAFESDWDYVEFLDEYGSEPSDIYFGPLTVYNQSYFGLFQLPFMGPPLDYGDYTGVFTSPNYCHTIQGKVRGESGFQTKSSFELGNTVKLEALIEDSNNNPISGGNATLNFTSPTGELIYSNTSLTSVNGLLSTTEFEIGAAFETGFYTVSIFWTDGVEIGFYTLQIEVVAPPSWLWLYIVLGVAFGLAIVAIPLATYTRRKIKTRNWEKHLQNLFVLAKDGRSIYGYSFGIEIQDPALISAALVAITAFVSDAVKSKKELRVIDLQDKKVILSHGTHTTTALIATRDFPVIRNRTEEFTKAFEKQYGGKIATWRGDTKTFKGVEALIQDYFPVSMEDRIIRGVKLKLIETKELLQTAEDPLVIIQILKNVTQLLSRYREIIEEYYMDDYAELIKAAEEKMNLISF